MRTLETPPLLVSLVRQNWASSWSLPSPSPCPPFLGEACWGTGGTPSFLASKDKSRFPSFWLHFFCGNKPFGRLHTGPPALSCRWLLFINSMGRGPAWGSPLRRTPKWPTQREEALGLCRAALPEWHLCGTAGLLCFSIEKGGLCCPRLRPEAPGGCLSSLRSAQHVAVPMVQ